MNEKLILLDSNSLIHRAFHALPPLTDKKGRYTNAVYGFMAMLVRLLEEEEPTHIAAAFDLKGPTFRHKMYQAYKGTRKPMPEELVPQIPLLKELLCAMNIKVLEKQGYEADDILGTMSRRFDCPTLIVTGDRDSLQLVSPTTHVYLTKKGIKDIEVYSESKLLEEGFTPQMFIDYKALRGDTSDNIPGIAGVGEVTAKGLISQYKTLDNVLAHATEIKGKLGEKITEGKESALLSRSLATIDTDVPIDCTLDDLKIIYPFSAEAKAAMTDLDLTSIIKRLKFVDAENVNKINKLEVKTLEIDDLDSLSKLVDEISKNKFAVAFDKDIEIFDGNCNYKIVSQKDLFSGIPYEDAETQIKRLLSGSGEKILFDCKTVAHKLCLERWYSGEVYDVMLLAYLVAGGKNIPSLEKALELNGYYGENPAAEMFFLKTTLMDKCAELGLVDLFLNIERPVTQTLFYMEKRGFYVDRKVLEDLNIKYSDELASLKTRIYELAGEIFNVNSPKKLAEILFEKLHLPTGKKNKSGFSSSVDVLNDIIDEHPIVPLVLRYRSVAKLQSTYIEGILKLLNCDNILHTEFKQAVTSTGRLSSVEPNLQNIPTRQEEGREIRRAFVPREGNLLVSADYSQIELRLLAAFSGDEALVKAYNESRDIHTSTAAEIFEVLPEEVTPAMRRDAKAVNFGIIYGISDWGLANNLSISQKRAKSFITKYMQTYPKVKEYMEHNVAFAKEHGYVKTLSGRIRFIPEINGINHNQRAFGERAAMNMPLQGSAADIIKIAMIRVSDALKGLKSELILQVHDELIVDTTPDELNKVKDILYESMEHAVKLAVPLTVNVESGKNWMEAK